MSGPWGSVNVLDEDPDLGRHVAAPALDGARRDAWAPLLMVETGKWPAPETTLGEAAALGLLVLEGTLVRSASVAGRQGVELLGSGDLARPVESQRERDAQVAPEVQWWALSPTRLAVLDARFTTRMCAHAAVIGELCGRLDRRSSTHAVRFAIIQQPRLSDRIRLLLWHLADRFGRVHPHGRVLPLPLPHGLLAQLVGARRPSVSRALKELERGASIARRPDGSWWLGSPLDRGERHRDERVDEL